MYYKAPNYRCCIIREWLLEAGVPQMEWPALSLNLNPTENLRDQLSCRVKAALEEEWNAMPQQTISRLVNSMRRRCQAVIDAQGHMTKSF
uniref:Uncharacterized protein n=1 Tax=Mola mola TaxID=94237 RepID=A0A3Q3XF76_MOLML